MTEIKFPISSSEENQFIASVSESDWGVISLSRAVSPEKPFMNVRISETIENRPERISPGAWRECLHGLRASGTLPEKDEAKSGYILVCSEAPMVGLDPHPSYAPDSLGGSDVTSWFNAYNCNASYEDLVAEETSDFKLAQEDIEDLEEPDIVMPCRVFADGRLQILEFSSDTPDHDIIADYEVKDIYERGFGMALPSTLDEDISPS